jgi:hypothetical protein
VAGIVGRPSISGKLSMYAQCLLVPEAEVDPVAAECILERRVVVPAAAVKLFVTIRTLGGPRRDRSTDDDRGAVVERDVDDCRFRPDSNECPH